MMSQIMLVDFGFFEAVSKVNTQKTDNYGHQDFVGMAQLDG